MYLKLELQEDVMDLRALILQMHELGQSPLLIVANEGGIIGLSTHICRAMPIDLSLFIRLRLQVVDNAIIDMGIQVRRFFHICNKLFLF